MMVEVRANLSFQDLRHGERIRVDTDDLLVAALIEAGYFTIMGGHDAAVDDPDRVRVGVADDLGSGDSGEQEAEEALDGDDPDQPGAQAGDGA